MAQSVNTAVIYNTQHLVSADGVKNGTNIKLHASRIFLALGLVAFFFVLSMGQPGAQDQFESLLYKTHVEHALLQPEDTHNEIPTVSEIGVH